MVSGIASVILGILLVLRPGTGVIVAAILLGAYLLVSGIFQVVFAFSLQVSAGGRILLFISGAASLILAILAFRSFGNDDATAIQLLAIWIAVGFIFRGVSTAAAAIGDPGLPGRGWEIFFGVISLLAGIVVLASPITSLVLLAWMVGIWLIVMGVFEIVSAFGIRKASKTVGDFVERRASAERPTA
ncbi:MAG: HdeD family acid-resistance protein [Candidatus Sericytochromatia bacterium]